MKLFAVFVFLSILLAGCGGGSREVRVNNSSTTTETKLPETARTETPTPTATPVTETAETERPIEFAYLGVTPSKDAIAYKIKVNTAKPISQVDLDVKYMDDGGKVIDETTYAWQNIVKSVRKPIERGKTYDVEDNLPEGATKAEVTLKRVIFEDGTRWNAN